MELLNKFLKENQTDSVFHSHASMGGIKGKFMFQRDSIDKFWDIYCNLIFENKNPSVFIAENSQKYLPVLVDVDLKYKDEEKIVKSLYSQKQLQEVIATYQSVLRNVVDNCESTDLYCVVLEKELYYEEKNESVFIKNGFHLHFPFLFIDKEAQETHIIPRVQNLLKDSKLFSDIVEDSSVVIDKFCCKVPWLLYGSKKNDRANRIKLLVFTMIKWKKYLSKIFLAVI